MIEHLEANVTGAGGYDQIPLEFLTLSVVHTEPPAVQHLHFGFPYRGTGAGIAGGVRCFLL